MTLGQKWIRLIQAKLNKVDWETPAGHWGDLYDGTGEVELTRQEAQMRHVIASGDMSPHRAATYLNELDGTKPWYSKLEYIQGIAAVASLFDKEMSRKTYQQGRDIRSILMSSCTADRIAWYWNNMIIRRRMSRGRVALMGSGTAPNESLHHEVNTWFRNFPELYPTTLELQLDVGSLGKLLVHNVAMYSPTTRQMRHSEVWPLVYGNLVGFTVDTWANYCSSLVPVLPASSPMPKASQPASASMPKASLPGVQRRQQLKLAIATSQVSHRHHSLSSSIAVGHAHRGEAIRITRLDSDFQVPTIVCMTHSLNFCDSQRIALSMTPTGCVGFVIQRKPTLDWPLHDRHDRKGMNFRVDSVIGIDSSGDNRHGVKTDKASLQDEAGGAQATCSEEARRCAEAALLQAPSDPYGR